MGLTDFVPHHSLSIQAQWRLWSGDGPLDSGGWLPGGLHTQADKITVVSDGTSTILKSQFSSDALRTKLVSVRLLDKQGERQIFSGDLVLMSIVRHSRLVSRSHS